MKARKQNQKPRLAGRVPRSHRRHHVSMHCLPKHTYSIVMIPNPQNLSSVSKCCHILFCQNQTSNTNLLRSKWVLKWKQIKGQKDIKGRLVAQGFQDKQSLTTFSGTTSRWGQRIVLTVATQFNWSVISADVSEAFLRGITFKRLAELDTTQPLGSRNFLTPRN